MDSFYASSSCYGCEKLEGVLEEVIPTWQERVHMITGLKVTKTYGSDNLNDRPPLIVVLEDGRYIDTLIVNFAWLDALNDQREHEAAVMKIAENCPGFNKITRQCGKITLEN